VARLMLKKFIAFVPTQGNLGRPVATALYAVSPRSLGATIFPIGLGTRVDKEFLEHLAKLSGGDAYFSADPEQLAEQFHGIIENLRQRYVLSYTSSNSKHDGAWRHVEVRPRAASLVVTTNGGYFAPHP